MEASSSDKDSFKEFVLSKIQTKTKAKVSTAIMELLSDHDVMIASSLQINVGQHIYDTLVAEAGAILKEE